MNPDKSSRKPACPTLSECSAATLNQALRSGGMYLDFGAFSVRLRSRLKELAALLQSVYPHAPFIEGSRFADADVELLPGRSVRRWVRPLARIEIDGNPPFGVFPRAQLLPHFEWGVNWAFANLMNAHLLLHSGAVEIGGKGVLLIARPGSGKSTLTAGLVARGARLLSDEFGVVRTSDIMLLPMTKPIALKNRAIQVLREWAPEATIGPIFMNTRKGNLAHQAVPASSWQRNHEPAAPRLVIFPQFGEGAQHSLRPVGRAQAFMELASNSFNYELLGPTGFETAAHITEQCDCYRFEYSNMLDAVDTVIRLCDEMESAPIPTAALA